MENNYGMDWAALFFVSGAVLVFLIQVGLVAVDYWTRVKGLPGVR